MKRKPIWVRWHDAAHISAGEWSEGEIGDTTVTAHTVGILIRKDKKHFVVAHTVDSSGNVCGVFSIPRTAVEDWGELHD